MGVLVFISIIAIVLIVIGFLLLNLNERLPGSLGIALIAVGGITLSALCFKAWDWIAAGYKTEILNTKYELNLTRSEVYFAGDTIEKEIINLTIPDYLCETGR